MSKVAKKTANVEAGTVGFEFATTPNPTQLLADISKLPAAIVKRLALHGLSQKIGDSYAGASDAKEAAQFANETLADLLKGNWATRQASTGPKVSLLAEAVARVQKIPVEKALATLQAIANGDGSEAGKKAGEEKVKAIRSVPNVRAAMAAIQAERAQAKAATAQKDGAATADLGALLKG
jgi:hypothetical protein